MLKDYSRKQIQLILNQIELFVKNKIEIESLIGSIEFLLSNIDPDENISPFWKEWGRLEEYYSVCVVEKNGLIDLQHPEIKEGISNLSKLSQDWLASYIKQSDDTVEAVAKIIDKTWLMCPNCDEAWESISKEPMVICPKCDNPLHNPRHEETRK